jgi:hypothetical protein
MHEREVIVLSGAPLPIEYVLDAIDELALAFEEECLEEKVGAHRVAARSGLRLKCSEIVLPCRRIDVSMIPAIRVALARLQWNVVFRVERVNELGESSALGPAPSAQRALRGSLLSQLGLLSFAVSAGLAYQGLARIDTLSHSLTQRVLYALTIGAISTIVLIGTLRFNRQVGLLMHLSVTVALAFLASPLPSRTAAVLGIASILILVATVVAGMLFLRRHRSPAHLEDRFRAFRWHADHLHAQ